MITGSTQKPFCLLIFITYENPACPLTENIGSRVSTRNLKDYAFFIIGPKRQRCRAWGATDVNVIYRNIGIFREKCILINDLLN